MTEETSPPTLPMLDDHLAMQLLHQRIVVLGTEVDDVVAGRITAQLLLLSARDPRADISLYINSPGGSVTAGLAIYDTMRLIPNDVSTLAMGLAASMGQFLLTADSDRDRWFDATEAMTYGIVDHVVTSLEDVRPDGTTRKVGLG